MYSVEQTIFRLHLFKHRPGGYEALSYSYFLMKFALGMVDTFGVVFVFSLGETMVHGIWIVAIYVFFQRLLVAMLLLPAGKILNQIGYRRIMLIALAAMAVKMYILHLVSVTSMNLLWWAAVFGAIYMSCYFLGFHGLFLDDNDDGKIGEQAGFLEMLGRSAAIVSPFLGGLILVSYGFSMLFIIGTFFMLTSALPLFLMPHHKHKKISVSIKDVWREVSRYPRFSKAIFYWNVQNIVRDVFWPLYMFAAIGGYVAFGLVYSITMAASSVTVYWAGKVYDRRRFHMAYPLVTLLQAMFWILRFGAQTLFGLVTVDILGRMMSPAWWMKIRRYELGKGEKMDSVVFGMAHEYMTTLGKMGGLVMVMLLLVVANYNYWVLAIPAVTGVLAAGWLVREK